MLTVLASVAASAQTWQITKTASANTIAGTPFTVVPPASTASVGLSSVHTAQAKNTSGSTQSANISISLRLTASPGNLLFDSKYASMNTAWADGDSYFINGIFPAGHAGGQLTSNLSGTKDTGPGTYTVHAVTSVRIDMVLYEKDDNTQTFEVKN